MTCTQRDSARYYCFLLLVVAAFVVLGSRPAVAQGQDFGYDECYDSACEMEFVGAIAASTSSTEIDTYAITNVSYDLEQACLGDPNAYCEYAAIESDLYDNGSWIDGNYSDDSFDGGDGYAEVDLADPVNVGDVYDLYNDHGYAPCYVYDENGDQYCDPTIFLVTYQIQIPTAAPTISSINPTDAAVGTSGQITVTGSGLVDAFGVAATPAITGAGVTLSVSSVDSQGTQEVLNYSIVDTATTGNQTLTMSNRFGTGSGVTFRVGDPTPVVTSVSPGVWQAGTTFPVTISGRGFGTSPSVSVSGIGVAIGSPINPTDTQFTANVTVNSDAPAQTVTVTVQSNGYLGNGFIGATNGQSSTGSNTAQVAPIILPTPQIIYNGSNIAGSNSTPVFAGQQIALTGSVPPLPSGVSLTSQTWSVQNQVDLTGGYCAPYAYNNSCGNAGQELQDPTMTDVSNLTFYWVNPGTSEATTYSYCVNNAADPCPASCQGLMSNQCMSASAPFTIKGPTSVKVTLAQAESAVYIYVRTLKNQSGPVLGLGNSGYNGIEFQASGANTSAGQNATFTWVQLLTNDKIRLRSDTANQGCSGGQTCTCYPPGGLPSTPNLDTAYPATNSSIFGDTPSTPLNDNEVETQFAATTYLMWDPALPSGCAPAYTDPNLNSTQSTCSQSIPIPLGHASWNWSGDAIDTGTVQSNQTDYNLSGCQSSDYTPFVLDSTYPQWQNIVMTGLKTAGLQCTQP